MPDPLVSAAATIPVRALGGPSGEDTQVTIPHGRFQNGVEVVVTASAVDIKAAATQTRIQLSVYNAGGQTAYIGKIGITAATTLGSNANVGWPLFPGQYAVMGDSETFRAVASVGQTTYLWVWETLAD